MEIFLKYIVMFLITVAFQTVFSVCFHFAAKQICENHSDDTANQLYSFLKYFSLVLVLVFFSIIILWDYIGFFYFFWYHKLGITIFWVYLWLYCKHSMGMLNHLICVIYYPRAAGTFEYDGFWGEFKMVDGKPTMIQEFAWLKLDLSKRLEK